VGPLDNIAWIVGAVVVAFAALCIALWAYAMLRFPYMLTRRIRRLARHPFTLCAAASLLLWVALLIEGSSHILTRRMGGPGGPLPNVFELGWFKMTVLGLKVSYERSAALVALPPLAWLLWLARFGFGKIRLLKRQACGLCPACGYDLRGSVDRCPECGTAAVMAG
jgi:hypothetical protein